MRQPNPLPPGPVPKGRIRCEARTVAFGSKHARCRQGATQLAADSQGVWHFCRKHARVWKQGRLMGTCRRDCGLGLDCSCMFGLVRFRLEEMAQEVERRMLQIGAVGQLRQRAIPHGTKYTQELP